MTTDDQKQTLKAQMQIIGLAELNVDAQSIASPEIPKSERLAAVGGEGGEEFAIEAPWPLMITGMEISARGDDAIQGMGIVNYHVDSRRVGIMDDRIDKVCLEPGEYIKGIAVKVSDRHKVKAGNLIVELVVHTNRRSTRPFGGGDPTKPWSELMAPDGFEVVGFHGAAGVRLDRIGIIIRKLRDGL